MVNVEEVQMILLAGEGWRQIDPGSLRIEKFETIQAGRKESSRDGFQCKLLDPEGPENLAGPLSALRAVRF